MSLLRKDAEITVYSMSPVSAPGAQYWEVGRKAPSGRVGTEQRARVPPGVAERVQAS